MSVMEILTAVEKLTDDERQQVLDALLRQAEVPVSDDEKHAELYRRLIAKGMLKAVPPRRDVPRDFEPVPIEGEPISETIIEERR